ncbi:MAG: CBS domain-containing protein [Rhodospirillaceae bacterium]|nr:CBS domain-containing protein [Rhodospirillaceae bacterium]
MKIRDLMTRDVRTANPDQTIRSAAQTMKEIDAGAIPIGEDDRLIGMITDRDIAVRAVADGLGPDSKIRDIMTPDIKYCFEDDELAVVAGNMATLKVRRMPVLNRAKRLVGVISLGDFADDAPAREVLIGVSRPGQPSSQ